jgi:hypothetical protein
MSDLKKHFTTSLASFAALCVLLTSAASAIGGQFEGWMTEPGVDPPSYAVTEPIDSNLNVDTVVLLCTEGRARRFLELDLYLSTPGPLLPIGADVQALKDSPSVEILVDGRTFPARLAFADDYVVVSDTSEGPNPSLSRTLLDALEHAETMLVRFDLLSEPNGIPASFDGQFRLNLRAGRSAIASVRRCTSPTSLYQSRVGL